VTLLAPIACRQVGLVQRTCASAAKRRESFTGDAEAAGGGLRAPAECALAVARAPALTNAGDDALYVMLRLCGELLRGCFVGDVPLLTGGS